MHTEYARQCQERDRVSTKRQRVALKARRARRPRTPYRLDPYKVAALCAAIGAFLIAAAILMSLHA